MSDCKHREIGVFVNPESDVRMWACIEDGCSRRFYPACPTCVDVGHRNIEHPAPPSDAAARLDVERLRAAIHDTQAIGWLDADAIVARYAALTPPHEPGPERLDPGDGNQTPPPLAETSCDPSQDPAPSGPAAPLDEYQRGRLDGAQEYAAWVIAHQPNAAALATQEYQVTTEEDSL